MDSDPPGPGGSTNMPPGMPSTGGVQQMDQLGHPKMGQGQMGQGQMGQGQMNNPDVKTEDIKSEVSGGENSQEPIYEETDSNDRQSGSQETQKGYFGSVVGRVFIVIFSRKCPDSAKNYSN